MAAKSAKKCTFRIRSELRDWIYQVMRENPFLSSENAALDFILERDRRRHQSDGKPPAVRQSSDGKV